MNARFILTEGRNALLQFRSNNLLLESLLRGFRPFYRQETCPIGKTAVVQNALNRTDSEVVGGCRLRRLY